MKKTKRTLSFLIAGTMLVSLAACAGQDKSTSSNTGSTGETSSAKAISSDDVSGGDAVKVGIILPLSGDAVNMGEKQRAGIELYVNHYNEKGVPSLGGKKIELVFSDTTSKPEVGVTEIERLITQEKVSCVIGPYQSAVGAATAPIAEKYKTPYLLSNCTSDEILQNNYNYVYRANNSNSDNASTILQFMDEYGAKVNQRPTKFAIIYENTDWGKGMQVALKNYITDNYVSGEIVLEEAYQANASDMSSIANKIKAANVDVVIPASYLNDALLLTQQLMDYKVEATIFSCGGGFCVADYIEKAGKNAEYTLACAGWGSGILDYKGDEAKALNEEYKSKMGYDLDEYGANGYLAAAVMMDAIDRAASAEPEAINIAMAATDIKGDHAALALHSYEGVKFGDVRGMHNQNIYAGDILTQVQDGKFVLIGPLSFIPDTPAIFPAPALNER